ncbi:P-loop containing nucleoside triphosphate hydrolase protein [Annulohypoxylon maeteangense]|uniref:P-loop containing nucleoside triphosphate hydrolase protein n=1 Tax=Annulohypoxylon maeteangense TaxID=1927788 RepID=UPI002008549F|nr:P-loop containing nucleoside triphosphate hydrolase protein [Annulohypoxylon maeteangense]KAI0888838.1 P-loop containing nucleoside triphosphate hydrolase protein [Annulohypoxylon maeteangense]
MPPLSAQWLSSKASICRLLVKGYHRTKVSPLIRTYASDATRTLQKISLRDYQEECIQSVLASVNNGHKRLGISLATGAGKTIIFTQLIDRIKPDSDEANQTLILAHRRELVEQAARHCANAYPLKKVEIEMGNMHASGSADITIASIQSINSGERIEKFNPDRFKLVLVDEAHHIVAPQYLRTLEHFSLDTKQEDSPILVGVSATFSRTDGLRLGAAIDEIVYHKDYVDMIGDKWLSDVIFTTVETKADISKVGSAANGDFHTRELSRVVNTKQVNEVTVRSWLAKASGRKSTLVFCVDLSHIDGLTETFHRFGVDARFVTGETPNVERSKLIDAFKNREFPVLVNCGVFTEGTDIPNIDCIILARPTRSRNLLVQMIGRGMRLHPDKTDCHIIDMVASLSTGIVTTPTLFGLDPSELLEKASVSDMQRLKSTRETGESQPARKVTFVDYDSVFDLIADTSGERHIRSISQHAWVQVGPTKWILSGPSGTFIRLERESTELDTHKFVAWETRALPKDLSKSPFAKPRKLLQAHTLIDAVHGSDKYASEHYPHYLISRYQNWRNGPPTDNQLEFLNKMRGEGDKLKPEDITKGKAADMITKLRHGARGRFATLDADRKRKERKQIMAQEKEKVIQEREKVVVGPLLA